MSVTAGMAMEFMSQDVSDLLQKNYAFISGGHSLTDELIITFLDGNLDASITDEQHKNLLEYLICITGNKPEFTVVIDRRHSKWGLIKELLRRIVEVSPGQEKLKNIYLLQPTGFFQSLHRALIQYTSSVDVHDKLKTLNSVDELYHLIDRDQLTSSLGGDLHYNNNDWVKHQQLIELLEQSCDQVCQDLKAASIRVDAEESSSDMTAGQLETSIQNLDDEQKQMEMRVEKMLAEAGGEIAQLKTINGETLASADLPPSSVYQASHVERLILRINSASTEYQTTYEKHKKAFTRSLKLRQYEEENNKLCAVLDEHLLFLVNFNPICDTADGVRKSSAELNQFDNKAKVDFCESEAFYKKWQAFLEEGSDKTSDLHENSDNGDDVDDQQSPMKDNRIELSCQRYNELMSVYREQAELCIQLHSHIDQAAKWCKQGQELLLKSVPKPKKAKKSLLFEEFDDIELFITSVTLKHLTDANYSDVMTPVVKAIVSDLITSLENLLASCDEKRQELKQMIEDCEKLQEQNSVTADIVNIAIADSNVTTNAADECTTETATNDAVLPTPSSCESSPVAKSENRSLISNIDKLYLSTRTNKEFSQLKPVAPTGTIRRKPRP